MIASTVSAMAGLLVLAAQAPAAWTALQAPAETALAEQAETAPAPAETPTETDTAEDAEPRPQMPAADTPAAIAAPVDLSASTPAPVTPLRRMVAEGEQAAILNGIEAALSAARTADGQFTQINADGSVMTGSFALRRPGRMRFDYDDPTPILIVSDGTTVAMEDSELETVDRVPLSSTPLGLILDNELSFARDVDVLRVAEAPDKVLVTVEDATGEVEGELTMVFAPQTYDLLGWITLDPDLQMTQVELAGVRTNGRIDPRLFRLDEAADEEDER